ncbi:MAG: hypothetical protein WD425_14555 [Nitrospirales bacterium]
MNLHKIMDILLREHIDLSNVRNHIAGYHNGLRMIIRFVVKTIKMKEGCDMQTRGTMWLLASMLVLLGGLMPEYVMADDIGQKGLAPIASGVIEGKVVEVETNTLVLEKNNGKIVRVRMPGKSGNTAVEFSKGDYIEAVVTPEGITTSARVVLNPEKHDINPNIR